MPPNQIAPATLPIALTTTMTVPLDGSVSFLDLGTLNTKSQHGILVDEIRFHIDNFFRPSPEPITLAVGAIAGGVETEIGIGDHKITDGFVPVMSLAPTYNRSHEYVSYQLPLGQAGTAQAQFIRWVLPRALYVTPKTQMRVTMKWNSAFFGPPASDFLIAVTIIGRAVLNTWRPPVMEVPYVSCWRVQRGTPDESPILSMEKDLSNVILKEITVQRFIAHAFEFEPNQAPARILHLPMDPLPLVMLEDPSGYAITQSCDIIQQDNPDQPFSVYGPAGVVFDPIMEAWTFRRKLERNQRFRAGVRRLRDNQAFHLSLIGSRPEAL